MYPLSPETIPSVTVRSARIDDLAGIRNIARQWVRDGTTGEVIESEIMTISNNIESSIHGRNERKYLVATKADEVIGVMGLCKPSVEMQPYITTEATLEVVNAFVSGSERGSGVGRIILRELAFRAQSNGAEELILNSGPRYKDSGWEFWNRTFGQPVDTRKNLYGPGGDAPVWKKRLPLDLLGTA